MSLAAVAVRNQRRRVEQQQQLAQQPHSERKLSLEDFDQNLKFRKVRLRYG